MCLQTKLKMTGTGSYATAVEGVLLCHFTLPHILYSDACCRLTVAARLEGREPSIFLGDPGRKKNMSLSMSQEILYCDTLNNVLFNLQ